MVRIKKTASIMLILAVAFTFIPLIDGQAFAASKKPFAPKITSAKVSNNTMTIKWGKAKNAKKYQVGIQSSKKKWVKIKTVKKNAKNKKKYTVKNKYKVKASGSKYKVYQYKFTYTIKKKGLKKLTYTFSGLKYNTNYTLAVRSVNGKKYSAWRTVKKKTAKSSSATVTSGGKYDVGRYSDAYIASQPWIGAFSITEDNNVTISYGSATIHIGQTWSSSVLNNLKKGATNNKYAKAKRQYTFHRWKVDPYYGYLLWDKNGNHIEETKTVNAEVYMFDIEDYDNFITVYVVDGAILGWCTTMENMGRNGSVVLKRGDKTCPPKGKKYFKNTFKTIATVQENGVLFGGFADSPENMRIKYDGEQEKIVGFHFINAYRQLKGVSIAIYNDYLDGKNMTWSGTIKVGGKEYTFKNQRFGAQAMAESMSASGLLTHNRSKLTSGPLFGLTNDQDMLIQFEASGRTVMCGGQECCAAMGGSDGNSGEGFITSYQTSLAHLNGILSDYKYVGLGLSGRYNCIQFCSDY